jgi:hypothetical protein
VIPVEHLELHRVEITVDARSGCLLSVSHPGPGEFLSSGPGDAGLVDLAYPIDDFWPLRRGASHATEVRIEREAGRVTLHWPDLAPSRDQFDLEGTVAATVVLTEADDGRSILMRCTIENDSPLPVPQVLFPDLRGLTPTGGEDHTRLRTGGFTTTPFTALQPRLDATWYPHPTHDRAQYEMGSLPRPMVHRWIDFGSVEGGFSLFPRTWYDDPPTALRVEHTELDPGVRLAHIHRVTIEPGEEWTSPDFLLTPHEGGWAKGIGPYREWVHAHSDRRKLMPRHVREGLGYRTVWICRGFPNDPEEDVAFRFEDLPRVAEEAAAHGLHELVVWFWSEPFQLPIPEPYGHLGTAEELAEAVEACDALGVNVSMFISVLSLADPTATRLGYAVSPTGWTYHPEFIPRGNPPYATGRATAGSRPEDEQWAREVVESCEHIIERYSPSICWDQVISPPVPGHLYGVFDQIIDAALEADPRATFSGESYGTIEKDAEYLDYTWNWQDYRDLRAFTAAFDAPRINCNINRLPMVAKYAFADNLYLNVMPSRPDDANATAYIERYPEISEALKQCAALRRQFLEYFVEGELIGECLLARPAIGLHISAYVIGDERALAICLNPGADSPTRIPFDPGQWLSAPGGYEVITYDGSGQEIARRLYPPGEVELSHDHLPGGGLLMYEFLARDEEGAR